MDPSHYQLYGNDLPWVIGKWGSRIKHVHLKDVVGRPGLPMQDFIFPLLGEGSIDWEAFTRALDEVGYDGYLSVEFESFAYYRQVLGGDPARAAELSMEQVRGLFEGEG
jgi:inosose dehydratase